MTGQEFTDAGLHKLSQEELAALNEWVRVRNLAVSEDVDLQQALAENQALEQQLAEARIQGGSGSSRSGDFNMPNQAITSTLVGQFTGWSGGTQFTLQNGMVWEQVGNETYTVSRLESPEVTIRPGMLGSWSMQVGNYNKRVRVTRIR